MSHLSETYLSFVVIDELHRRGDIAEGEDYETLRRNIRSLPPEVVVRTWDLNAPRGREFVTPTMHAIRRTTPTVWYHALAGDEREHALSAMRECDFPRWPDHTGTPAVIVFRTMTEKTEFVSALADRVRTLVRRPASASPDPPEVPTSRSYQGPTAAEIAAAIWATPIAEANPSPAAPSNLFDRLSSPDPAHAERAMDAINDFTRARMREDGHFGRIVPPLNITNDELDREIAAMPAAVSAHTGIEAPFTLAERVAFLGELRKILRDSGAMEIRTGPGLEIEAVGADRFRITVPELPPAPPEGALTLSSFSPLQPDYLFHLAGPDGTLLLGVTTDGEVVGEARGLEQLLTSLEMSRRKRTEQLRVPLRRFYRPEDPARPSGRSDIP